LFDTFDRRADRNPAADTLGENIDFLAQIRRLRASGFELMGSLWTTPPWAARPDQGRLPDHRLPRDWADWDRYVSTMLGHYKDAVKYWEIWNEPGWWGSLPERGTPEDYLEMVRRTSRLIRRIDPSAKIIATDYHRSPRVPIPSGYYGEIARHVDIYSYHHYWAWDASDSAAEVDAWLARRAELQKGNPAIRLWNTEGGVNGVDWYNHYTGELAGRINHSDFARRPAALCARLFLHSFALGTEKVFYYQIGSARSFAGDYNFVPGNAMSGNLGFPRPGGVAYAVLAAHLSGARFLRVVPVGEACEGLVFSLPDGRAFAAAWIKTEKRPGSILKFNTARPGVRAQTGDVFGTFRPLPDAAAVVVLKTEPAYWIFEGEREATDWLASLVPLPGQESGAAGDDYAEPFEFASRVLTERWFFADLEPFANARFHDDGRVPGKTGWTRQGPDNDLDALAPGIHRYHGVPFRIPDDSENNACIVLGGHRTVSDNIRKVDIPVNRTSRAFYFMVAAAWVQSWSVGSFSIRYADGTEESLALSRRINIDDWANRPPVRNDEARYVRVACEGGTKERYVYVVQWVNPHPEKRVASLVFEAPAAVNAIPILLAVTGTEN
jgi:hypothetical protein